MVEVDTVKTGRIVETRDAVGTVRAFESITVTAKVAGIIEDRVRRRPEGEAGDVLVSLDTMERRADIEAAVAEIRRATASRNEIATRLDRARQLRRSGSGTEAQVEDLTAQVRTLESVIASAEARRKGAEARLENSSSGRRSRGASAPVRCRSAPMWRRVPITTLDDLSKVRLDFSVPENLLGRVKPGQDVNAISAAFRGRVFQGKVSLMDTASIRSPGRCGSPPNSTIPTKPCARHVPGGRPRSDHEGRRRRGARAVVSEGLRQIVFTVKDNKVERRVIRIGQRQGGKVEVVEGLRPGETIVVLGLSACAPARS